MSTMHQAQVSTWGEPPKYTSAPLPPPPGPNELRIKVVASGLHRVVQSRATGRHYTSGSLPHVPGVDGIGVTEDGKNVYFSSFQTGSMAEYVNMPKAAVMPLPEGLDPVKTAGIVNPGMSSWMALKTRTTALKEDFTVLILGATSASGKVAVHLARALGAKKVIGAARDKTALESLDLDETIVINSTDVTQTDLAAANSADVILDYIYGPLTEHLFNSIKPTKPVEYVQIGSLSALTINLPGAILRSKNLTIRGSGPGAWSTEELAGAMPELLVALKEVPVQGVRVVKLEDVEKEWNNSGNERLLFVP